MPPAISTTSYEDSALLDRQLFEDSLFSSRTQSVSPRRRWITAASVGVQLLAAGAVVLVPILHPEALPRGRADTPAVVHLFHPQLPPPPEPLPVRASARSSSNPSLPAPATVQAATRRLPSLTARTMDDAPPALVATGSFSMGSSTGSLPSGLATGGSGTGVSVARAGGGPRTKPLAISSGVTSGLLLAAIRPAYPRIAIAARIQGTVVLSAIIDRSGHITALRVVSGPEMLQTAALDAVRNARYRPYLLNGEPTEVQTTISVNFNLNS